MVDPELDKTLTAGATPPTVRAAAEEGDLPTGMQLDHFRIEKKVGSGGMGEVYLATDLALDRPVAVKVLAAGSSSGRARDRLVREARAQARVHHANVGHIYYIGEDGGRLYFAMEYLTGGTLADKIDSGPMPVDAALDAIHDAALGLREAQRSGFLHRDVKPSNLMHDAHGMLKVTDFGLAAGGAPDQAADRPVQQTTMAGTPLYMAPEQARGEDLDLRADIYALGATLYHLVSGKPPFQAATVEELNSLHRSANRPHVPRKGRGRTAVAAIDALVAKMMAPDPKDRFASYDDLVRAIELASTRHTRPAGLFVRCIAQLVDLLLAMLVVGLLLLLLSLATDGIEMGNTILFGTFALGQTLLIAATGTTPGKALFELEVISLATGEKPTLRTAIVRGLALYGAPLGLEAGVGGARLAGLSGLPIEIAKLVVVAAYLFVIGALLHAIWRVPGKRAPWDRIAGTMVRYRTTRPAAA